MKLLPGKRGKVRITKLLLEGKSCRSCKFFSYVESRISGFSDLEPGWIECRKRVVKKPSKEGICLYWKSNE